MAIPQSVQNLKLCYAFKGYKQKVEDCISVTTETEFFIEDNIENKCTVIVESPTDDKICKVINISSSEAVLLAIDNKLISNREIADGALFNMDDFHFIEFKTNAEGFLWDTEVDGQVYTFRSADWGDEVWKGECVQRPE